MRLINLDALNKYPIRRHRCDKKNANPHFINGIESVLEYANELPVVEERKHGHWRIEPYLLEKTGCCSICGEQIRMSHEIYKYCPNCGQLWTMKKNDRLQKINSSLTDHSRRMSKI